ncbi:hypothetical protein MRX96_059703 [Rhipicephalus microplus]
MMENIAKAAGMLCGSVAGLMVYREKGQEEPGALLLDGRPPALLSVGLQLGPACAGFPGSVIVSVAETLLKMKHGDSRDPAKFLVDL